MLEEHYGVLPSGAVAAIGARLDAYDAEQDRVKERPSDELHQDVWSGLGRVERAPLLRPNGRTAVNPGDSASAPGEIRTPDLRFRRPTLYPAELRARGRPSLASESDRRGLRVGRLGGRVAGHCERDQSRDLDRVHEQ
jgi:hypothetical protein